MLTISQLAAHAGVTVATVRHYHKIGLMPEPPRDASGYRSYDAAAAVRLIRIHVLASAGVPLAKVKELLHTDPETFAREVRDIDARLCAEAQELQCTRERLARLAAGDYLALPVSVVEYLDRLRALGIDERYVAMERDAWIIVAAQLPDAIETIMVGKFQQLDNPDTIRLYSLVSDAFDATPDDPRLEEVADVLDRIFTRTETAGELNSRVFGEGLINLLDRYMLEAAPASERLLELLYERGWRGWTHPERDRR